MSVVWHCAGFRWRHHCLRVGVVPHGDVRVGVVGAELLTLTPQQLANKCRELETLAFKLTQEEGVRRCVYKLAVRTASRWRWRVAVRCRGGDC